MKKIHFSFAALSGCILLASCSHNHINEVVPVNSSVRATFSGSISQMTRVVGTSWEAGDSIGIFMLQSGAANLTGGVANVKHVTFGDGTFTASDADATVFYPTDKAEVDFVAYCPYSELSGTADDPTFVISNWNETAQGSLDLLVAKSTAHGASNPDVSFAFSHLFSKLELNISADAETSLTDADLAGLKVRITGINRPATYHLIGQTVSYATALDEDVFMQVASDGTSANAILPTVAGGSLVFELANGDSFTWDISDITFKSGMCYTYGIVLRGSPASVEARMISTINDWNTVRGGEICIGQDIAADEETIVYEAVDLGLPSGLLWAASNIGTARPEDYGIYFAWGETSAKTYYEWSTYRYCDGSKTALTKYSADDGLTELLSADDAAAALGGGDWRMPTKADWSELISACTWSRTSLNGVVGYKVESKSNGNSIFLPAAGEFWNEKCYFAGENGWYWSSSLYDGDATLAWTMSYSSGAGVNGNRRDTGRSIRAVRSAN